MPMSSKIFIIIVLAIFIQGFRIYFSSCVCPSSLRLDGKTVLITGANSGIGLETARVFHSRGARVVLACRDPARCKQAAQSLSIDGKSSTLAWYQLDLASVKSIQGFTRLFLQSESRLDILINNAGVMAIRDFTKTEDGFEMQFGVNHLGHFLLTHGLLDTIKKSAPARVVLVSSYFHVAASTGDFNNVNDPEAYSPWNAYARSKLANVLFARELAKRVRKDHIIVTSLHPGSVSTQLGRHFIPSWLKIPVIVFNGIFIKTALQGAQTTLCCATDDNIDLRSSGSYYSECKESSPSQFGSNDTLAEELWTLSERLLAIKYSI